MRALIAEWIATGFDDEDHVLSVAGSERDGFAAAAKASFDSFDHRGEVGGQGCLVLC